MSGHVIGVPVATVWSAPDAPRDVDAAALADRPDAGALAALHDEDRRGLHGRILTQALLGEPVRILAERGDWCEVVLPWQPHGRDEGYPGWVRRTHVLADRAASSAKTVVVIAPQARCTPDTGAPLHLSYGTVLSLVADAAGHTAVSLPDGRVARLPSVRVRRTGEPVDVDALLSSARRFIGLRYLWGGLSGWGLDCSGLVHLVHRAHGVAVPRDAGDQQETGRPSSLDAAAPGELYFFARPGRRAHHVGFVTSTREHAGNPTMLHAPEGEPGDGGLVEDAPLAPHRFDTLVASAGFLPR
ncbi:MAG: C40 family peptidase [Actinomycetota bacterium]|nr:C40 family peptidase [Actinomycetota bacterium]